MKEIESEYNGGLKVIRLV